MKHALVEIEQLCNAIFKLSSHYGRLINVDGATQNNKQYYTYIPINPSRVADIISLLQKRGIDFHDKYFMDIGCGVPAVPAIFQALGCHAHGLEYNKAYCKTFIGLIEGDLLTYNFDQYDILYAYNPIYDEKLMNLGLINIIRTMKVGATFIYVPASRVCDKAQEYLERVENGRCWIYTKSVGDVMPKEIEPIVFTRKLGGK